MEGERFVGFVYDWQTNAAQMRLVRQLAIFFPTVQSGQRIELALDGPISANHSVFAVEQPNAQQALQSFRTL
jgi:hypothetical protein